ncbi:helix-turn-helix domain-containing protein [Lactobacillus taiwanensis]|uniref:HTH cro/C1-type domain-containing protein n=1 Tax=Lactobacillus taiwanensis TaxID=508451 RepID=A0A256LEI8_9LACO|nr:helix-turn-helix transcriptional regulator [Lactobacillus taiwanensis]OYR87367.1 hypothetical protein CBF53_07915 [Lactobacillus taiwanensis]OYR90987.1 hypothetical protein CBF70_07355 [Lactobacillus taiwanensis]OYR91258.1 hypothetical protein CBF59_06805 [Lactobacillus taiwanensis]
MKNRIRQLRKEHGLKQRELAEEFNRYILQNELKVKPINFSVVSKWETGKSSPTKATYEALADYFDVLVPYLQGATIYEILDPLEKGIYSHVTEAMDRAFDDYALLPVQQERILKAIAYSIDYGEFN